VLLVIVFLVETLCCTDGNQREFDHKTRVINENIEDLQDVSQLCTKQVGTREMIK